ncbi:hypothetical protein [Streptomyces sp. SID3212]|uniref:hypothetical protein n=1 Tax=Streptomyces sp. SID3212 TaxID=2690259 RepID=UPI0013715289
MSSYVLLISFWYAAPWFYPGDGYGAVNIGKRRQILLPPGAPDPATFTQILAAGDATGDGKTDFFATIGDALWALTGYSGATVEQATRLSAVPWAARELVTAQDITGDGVADTIPRHLGPLRQRLRQHPSREQNGPLRQWHQGHGVVHGLGGPADDRVTGGRRGLGSS